MATYREIAAYSSSVQYYTYDIVTYGGEYWWARTASYNGGNPVEGVTWTKEPMRVGLFVPTYSQDLKKEPKVLRASFGDGYNQSTPIGMDFDKSMEFGFNWENTSDRETKGILEFAKLQKKWSSPTTITSDETISGFWYQPPFPYQDYAGIYTVSNYSVSFSSYNKNSFSVTFKLKKIQAAP